MIAPFVEVALRCPVCGGKVTSVTGYRNAVEVVRRRCRRGHRWVVKVSPVLFAEDRAAHKLEWTPLDPLSASNDKSTQAAVRAEVRS